MLAQGRGEGLEAWVEGKENHQRLNELDIKQHEAKGRESAYTECYIETIDETFSINLWKPAGHEKEYQVLVRVDGRYLEARAWLKANAILVWDKVYTKEEGEFRRSDLKFQPLPTTDDRDEVTLDPLAAENIGTIEIILDAGKFKDPNWSGVSSILLGSGVIHEKDKKLPYSVTAADPTVCERPSATHYTFVPDEEERFSHRFIFKYRPRAVLVKKGMIDEPQRPPSPPPARPARKRRLDAVDVDAVMKNDDEEGHEDGDVKPDLNAKRVKYLEEQVRFLSSQLKRSSSNGQRDGETVDITNDDDDDDDED